MPKMKVPAFFFSVFLLAAFLVPIASTKPLHAQAPPAAPNEKYVYCFSGSSGPIVYFSDIFAAVPTSTTVGPHAGQNGFPEFSGPFLAFLQNKYGYKSDSNSPPRCRAIYNPNPAGFHVAQATRQAAQDLAKQANQQVVETGWKSTP